MSSLPCLCRGRYLRGQLTSHVIWVAFLLYDNDDFDEPASLRDTILPVNLIACWLGNTNIIHCQIVGWDDDNDTFITWSADQERGVHKFTRKTFARGWKFIQIDVTLEQELAVFAFLDAQVGKRFDRMGIFWLYVWPVPSDGSRWFCSELVVAALQHGGLLRNWRAPHTVKPHELYEYMERGFIERPKALLLNNPVQATALQREMSRVSLSQGATRTLAL